ncbi:hypothetical protein C7974DRAFT_324223 [Boeremia exigua]|uniref:uncharacterized protein n=1 Tax=Boeremia exigua TaxID=749465 RepID=UPI001E8EAF4C|nr:uncharacterized protein C7974DRAFT_324223 [Boeremia exigua]KAH6611674.1 hypothetical protein C7974DRAFT_324223 [Boeremia exigua]
MADAVRIPAYSSSNAVLYLIPVCTLSFIALALVVVRVYTRMRRIAKVYLDDWLIVAAEVFSLTDTALVITAFTYGWGKPSYTFTPEALRKTLQLLFAMQLLWTIALCLIRVAVACSLLRFGAGLLWRNMLYFIIGLQVVTSSSYMVILFGQCTPMSANWETIPDIKCWDRTPITNYKWALAAMYIVMDLTLSLMPIHLIRALHRSTTERVLVCVLMSLGLLATAVACIKMTTYSSLGKGDVMQASIRPVMLTILEQIVGIIVCSLACLKGPVENELKRLGILKQRSLTTPRSINALNSWRFSKQRDDSGYGTGGRVGVVADHVVLTSVSSAYSLVNQSGAGDASHAA